MVSSIQAHEPPTGRPEGLQGHGQPHGCSTHTPRRWCARRALWGSSGGRRTGGYGYAPGPDAPRGGHGSAAAATRTARTATGAGWSAVAATACRSWRCRAEGSRSSWRHGPRMSLAQRHRRRAGNTCRRDRPSPPPVWSVSFGRFRPPDAGPRGRSGAAMNATGTTGALVAARGLTRRFGDIVAVEGIDPSRRSATSSAGSRPRGSS